MEKESTLFELLETARKEKTQEIKLHGIRFTVDIEPLKAEFYKSGPESDSLKAGIEKP